MYITQHADRRMNQRGISRRLVDFTLRHGRIEGDKHVLDRQLSRRLIDELNEELRLAKQVLDKGGVTVVEGEDTVITTYNRDQPPCRPRAHPDARPGAHPGAGPAPRPVPHPRLSGGQAHA